MSSNETYLSSLLICSRLQNAADAHPPLSLIALLTLLTVSPAYPRGSKGHEIVAAIAETQLTDAARQTDQRTSPASRDISQRIDICLGLYILAAYFFVTFLS